MIRYRHDPENPEKPIIEAAPKDLERFRSVIRSSLHRAFPNMGGDGVEDAAQTVMFVAWRAVAAGAVRGRYANAPEGALRAWLIEVAWHIGMNMQRSARRFASSSEAGEEGEAVELRSLPDAIVDARRMLEVVARHRHEVGIRAILMLVEGATWVEVARAIGVSVWTAQREVQKARERLAAIRDRGLWREPRQPMRRSPRERKRRR